MCKWTQPFWGTDCRRSSKSLSSAQAASLCSAGIERAGKCLQGVSMLRDAVTVPTVCFPGVLRGCRGGSSLRPKPSASICSGDCSYSFQGSSELIRITVTVSLFLLQNAVTGNGSPQEFPRIFGNYSYMT